MRRLFGMLACLGGTALAIGVVATSEPMVSSAAGPVVDAGGDAGPSSIYLVTAAKGVVAPPSIDDAEAFCALVNACADVPTSPPKADFQGCVRTLMDNLTKPDALNSSLTIRECGLSATSCSGLRACILKGADRKVCDGIAMDGDKPVGKCDLDARAVTCWRGKVLGVRNCGLADELCNVKDGKPECQLYGACPASFTPDWSCAGPRMVKCQEGKPISIDCSVFALTCVKDPSTGQAGCAPPVPTKCKSPDKITCDGTSAVSCVLGREVRVDCGAQGMSCGDPSKPADDHSVGVCEMPTPTDPKEACDPDKYTASCSGSEIKYCSTKGIRSFPCRSIGATKCVMDKGSGPRCTAG